MVLDEDAGAYVPAEARCTARWANSGENFAIGQICGRRATRQVADLWVCDHHYKRVREWMETRDGRDLAAAKEHAKELHRQQMQLDRERAKEQIELDRQRILHEEAARAESSVVYYVQREDGLIKIGTSRTIAKRLVTLKHEHGPLRLLATHGGAHKEEHEAHAKFKTLRAEGEWFRADLPLLEHIEWIRRSGDLFRSAALPECVATQEIRASIRKAKAAARAAAQAA